MDRFGVVFRASPVSRSFYKFSFAFIKKIDLL